MSTSEPSVDAAAAVIVDDPAAAPTDELRDGLVAQLTELLGDGVVESHVLPGKDLWVRVTAAAWQQSAETLRITMGARYFGFLSAIDWMPSPFGRSLDAEVDTILSPQEKKALPPMTTGYAGGDTRFQVIARLANLRDHWGITLKVDAGDESPSIPTWTKVFAGAEWHEREAWEMFGIDFVGHPFLRPMYLPGAFEGNPLRKDFPLLARFVKPWPGIVDVEPLPGIADDDGADDVGAGEGDATGAAAERAAG